MEAIRYVDPTTGEILQSLDAINIYPAKHFVTPKERLGEAIQAIRTELRERLELLNGQGRLLEEKMKGAAKNLEFEEAANLRDKIKNLRQKLVGRA